MPKNAHQLLKEQIEKAIVTLLTQQKIPDNQPLMNFVDDILRQTYTNLSQHFLENHDTLRTTEKNVLHTLQTELHLKIDLSLIEKSLFNNLSQIKPIWGELFGTDRGIVYNTFLAIRNWPCFSWQNRLLHQEYKQQQLATLNLQQSDSIDQLNSQLQKASLIIKKQEETNSTLAKRTASQFVTIHELKQKLAEKQKAEKPIIKMPVSGF